MTAVLISLAIFLVYVLGVCIGFGRIPSSISDTFYKLEEVHKNLGWLFTAFCWGVLFTLMPPLLEMTPESYQFTAFLACAGLGFVGAAPHFKSLSERQIHYIGATVCILSSQIWALLICWWIPLLCWAVYLLGTIIYMKKHPKGNLSETFRGAKPMFWVEVTAFVSVFTIIFTHYGG